MIVGIGIDSIEIHRFAHWHRYSYHRLIRIFSDQEIKYCLSEVPISAQRFAVRFAAREALVKALNHGILPGVPLLTVCKAMSISHNQHNSPIIHIHWDVLAIRSSIIRTNPALSLITPLISFTHSNSIATALIILQQLQSKV